MLTTELVRLDIIGCDKGKILHKLLKRIVEISEAERQELGTIQIVQFMISKNPANGGYHKH